MVHELKYVEFDEDGHVKAFWCKSTAKDFKRKE